MKKLKGNESVEYRHATSRDIEEFYGYIPATMKALIFFVNGTPSGLGGYKMENGNLIVFSDIRENVKVNKYTILRCANVIMDFIKEKDTPMYAVTNNKKLLKSLGFVHIGEVEDASLFEFYGG